MFSTNNDEEPSINLIYRFIDIQSENNFIVQAPCFRNHGIVVQLVEDGPPSQGNRSRMTTSGVANEGVQRNSPLRGNSSFGERLPDLLHSKNTFFIQPRVQPQNVYERHVQPCLEQLKQRLWNRLPIAWTQQHGNSVANGSGGKILENSPQLDGRARPLRLTMDHDEPAPIRPVRCGLVVYGPPKAGKTSLLGLDWKVGEIVKPDDGFLKRLLYDIYQVKSRLDEKVDSLPNWNGWDESSNTNEVHIESSEKTNVNTPVKNGGYNGKNRSVTIEVSMVQTDGDVMRDLLDKQSPEIQLSSLEKQEFTDLSVRKEGKSFRHMWDVIRTGMESRNLYRQSHIVVSLFICHGKTESEFHFVDLQHESGVIDDESGKKSIRKSVEAIKSVIKGVTDGQSKPIFEKHPLTQFLKRVLVSDDADVLFNFFVSLTTQLSQTKMLIDTINFVTDAFHIKPDQQDNLRKIPGPYQPQTPPKPNIVSYQDSNKPVIETFKMPPIRDYKHEFDTEQPGEVIQKHIQTAGTRRNKTITVNISNRLKRPQSSSASHKPGRKLLKRTSQRSHSSFGKKRPKSSSAAHRPRPDDPNKQTKDYNSTVSSQETDSKSNHETTSKLRKTNDVILLALAVKKLQRYRNAIRVVQEAGDRVDYLNMRSNPLQLSEISSPKGFKDISVSIVKEIE